MPRTMFSGHRLLLAAVLAVLVFSQSAPAQPVAVAPDRSGQVGALLVEGRQLETDRRWGEALALYEDAIRKFPGDLAVRTRFDFTRLHYDLGRRYGDESFSGMLSGISVAESLDLYSEVLLKIQAHYVESPDWQALVRRGTTSFEVALSEPVFLGRYVTEADHASLDVFRSELNRRLDSLVVQTRSDARMAVAVAAEYAAERLGISPTAVVLEYTCGITNTLDVYSAYLTPGQLAEVYSQIEGNFVGLGIELKAEGGSLLIVRVINGSPAAQAGILNGDRILIVDGHSTKALSTEQAADLLQGISGSFAELVVQTVGQQPRRLSVRRDRVEVPSIDEVQIVDRRSGIGYMKLTCFQKTTTKDLDTALWQLYREGMKSLIIDLRGNPGGLLVTAVEVVDKFVDNGVIVSTHGRSAQEDFTYSAHREGTWGVPLVVLIDSQSASAAEIFAGAIRDHKRGTVVGCRSYGKGSVQGIFPLGVTSAGVRLTTAKFYSPDGHPYSGIGVEPDLIVQEAARPVYHLTGEWTAKTDVDNRDAMLDAAIGAARQSVRKR